MLRLAAALALAPLLAFTPLAALAAPGGGYTSCLDKKGQEETPEQARKKAEEEAAAARAKAAEEEKRKELSGAEKQEYDSLTSEIARYEDEAKLFRQEVQLVIEKKYDEKRRFLSDNYEKAITDLEQAERKEREDAIAQFEEFLSRYPDDKEYTPDAMFRLAELYYEKTNDDYIEAHSAWLKLAQKAANANQEAPPEPQKAYDKSIALYQKLITQFPDYHYLHGVYYLLAYCLGEMNQGDEALKVFGELIDKYPQSPFVAEAWMRIGDWYFDQVKPDSLERAADAYAHIYSYPGHPLYPRALYKLGWTYWRMADETHPDAFQKAVESFSKLLDFYVDRAKKTGKDPRQADVWPESVQYTAISFADEHWGGVDKAVQFFQALGGRVYEPDVYKALGDIYFDRTQWDNAVTAYKLVIARDPLSPDAPKLQSKIVQAWARALQPDKEAAEREVLVANYGPDSAWFQKNQNDPDLVKEVRDLGEKMLMSAAAVRHAHAQALKKAGKLEDAVAEYRVAARAYASYLARFPHSKSAYDLEFAYADCLFNSLDFEQAARVYEQVRDDPASTEHQAEAALEALQSWEAYATALVRQGKLVERKVLTSKDRKEGEVVKPEAIPPVYQSIVRDSDILLKKAPNEEKAPAVAYKAGEIFYTYNDYPEARCRFEDVVARYPQADVAQYAANLIIETYLTQKNWAAVEQASARLQKLDVAKNKELNATLQKFKLGGRFNRAMQLMDQKRWEDAAGVFLALVAEDPHHEFADKALYNAASCYEQARRFESALKLYERIYADYPKSTFADEALFRVAYNAENTYDFDKAVDKYLLLVDKYPQSKSRKAALYNAARSLENLQRYDDAAKAFQRYAQLYPDSDDAAETQFHAALIYEKKKEWQHEIKAMEDFIKKFSPKPKVAELVVQAHLKMALAYKELGNDRATKAEYQATVSEFARRGLKADANPVAAAAAAEARFALAEYDFTRYDAIKLPATTNPRKLKAALTAKLNEAKKVGPQYDDVMKYKRPDWILAAFYRKAFMLERLAETLYEAPIPPEFKRPGREEYLAAYQDQLAQFAQPYEDQAVAVYIQALDAAHKFHVKNEWTKKIAESLARYRPKEYPILKDAKGDMLFDNLSPAPLADTPEGPAAPAPEVPPAGAATGKLGQGDN